MARKKRKRIASRGSVNNIILKSLVTGDKYGYEIIKDVEKYSEGKIILKQPSLYSSLSRFEDKQFVTSYWGDSDIGGRRHYYHLTDIGLAYYKKAILKESNENFESETEEFDTVSNTIENNLNDDNNTNIISNDCEYINEISSTNNSLTLSEQYKNIYNEVDSKDIPAIADFEINDNALDNDNVVYEHKYHQSTSIENIITNQSNAIVNNDKNEDITNESQNVSETVILQSPDNYEQVLTNKTNNDDWNKLVDSTKKSNKIFAQSYYSKLYIKKPKKEQKIIRDKNGIFVLRDEDFIPEKKSSATPIIIDNVIKRSKANNNLGYTTYTNINNIQTKSKQTIELSDEEKLKKNENFVAKFNLLTKSKMKPVSTPILRSIEEPKTEKIIDYRSKLNAIIESNSSLQIDDNEILEKSENINNLFNYVDEEFIENDSIESDIQDFSQNSTNENHDKFIEFDTTEEFDIKVDNKQYIEKINNYTTPLNQVNMLKYENSTQAILVDRTYLLVNKIKMILGIIITLLMILEVGISYLLLSKLDLINFNDKKVFISALIIIFIFAGVTIIPYFINPNSHKANNFKFKYSIWFGILTFMVSTILIYCVNALNGFELDNFKYYAVKLIVPISLVLNFIISPIIYNILINNKAFYD